MTGTRLPGNTPSPFRPTKTSPLHEDTMTAPAIAIHKFWTNYEPDPADPAKLKPVDWVAYGPIGSHDRSVTHDRVARLAKLQPLAGSQNPAVEMAHARWAIIEKHYQAWLAGQEPPTEGTPLAAWNALTPEQGDVLRANSIKTVEDVAGLTDAHITRLPLPNMRELTKQARHFIDASEQTRFAARLAEKEREVEALKAENAERADRIAALNEKVDALGAARAAEEKPGAEAPSVEAAPAEEPSTKGRTKAPRARVSRAPAKPGRKMAARRKYTKRTTRPRAEAAVAVDASVADTPAPAIP
jgi:hypothetical protein